MFPAGLGCRVWPSVSRHEDDQHDGSDQGHEADQQPPPRSSGVVQAANSHRKPRDQHRKPVNATEDADLLDCEADHIQHLRAKSVPSAGGPMRL
jgi:hypothetical protein